MEEKDQILFQLLEDLKISTTTVTHEAAFTVAEQAKHVDVSIPGITKQIIIGREAIN